MIKFFRKIRQRLLSENKFTKYLLYALGEIIMVMIGILLALQVNNYNEKSKNKKKEKDLLASINKEFLLNKIQFDSVVLHHRLSYKYCKKLVDRFPLDLENVNLDTLGLELSYALDAWTFNPSQGTVQGLINSSSMDLISNDELRSMLVSWPDLIVDLQEDEVIAKNVIHDLLDPYLAEHLDFDSTLIDPRANLSILESLKFEYLIKLRLNYLIVLFAKGQELEITETYLNRILQLTSTNPNDQILSKDPRTPDFRK